MKASVRRISRTSEQRVPGWLYLACFLPPLIVLSAVISQPYVDPLSMLRDPAVVASTMGVPNHVPMYYGFVSNLGILLWSAAASVCLFTGIVLMARAHAPHATAFMVAAGLVTGILVVDDLYMVHEVVFAYLTGFDGVYLVLLYGTLMLLFIVKFADVILQHNPQLFIASLLLFGTSVGIDFVTDYMPPVWALNRPLSYAEDGAKFLGIAAWTTFFVRASYEMLTTTPPEAAR